MSDLVVASLGKRHFFIEALTFPQNFEISSISTILKRKSFSSSIFCPNWILDLRIRTMHRDPSHIPNPYTAKYNNSQHLSMWSLQIVMYIL